MADNDPSSWIMAEMWGLGHQLFPRRFSQLLLGPALWCRSSEWGIPRVWIPYRMEPKQVKGRTVEAVLETGGNNGTFIWLDE